MKKIDAYLSLIAQAEWPTAIVWKIVAEKEPEVFLLERAGETDVVLGNVFREARAGLTAYLSSARSRREASDRKEN